MNGSRLSALVRSCPACDQMMWTAHMVWSGERGDWVCRLHSASRPATGIDWSEIDALCRERSVLLDCNDVDRVDVVLRYSRN